MKDKPYVFLSYSSKEKNSAKFALRILEQNGLNVYIAPDSFGENDTYNETVPAIISECSVCVVLVSKKAQSSQWVQAELEAAYKAKKPIISFIIDNCDIADDFNFLFTKSKRIIGYEKRAKAFSELVNACREACGLELLFPIIPDFSAEEKKRRAKKAIIALIIAAAVCAVAAVDVFGFIIPNNTYENGTVGNCEWSYSPSRHTLVISGEGRTDGDYLTWDDFADEIETLVIEDGVENVSHALFKGCSNLSKITFPDTLSKLDYSAFENCTSLRNVTLPRDLNTIGERAFYGCESLEYVSIPKKLVVIGKKAFMNCPELKTITITASVKGVEDYALGFTEDENGNIEKIENYVISTENGAAAEKYGNKYGFNIKYK